MPDDLADLEKLLNDVAAIKDAPRNPPVSEPAALDAIRSTLADVTGPADAAAFSDFHDQTAAAQAASKTLLKAGAPVGNSTPFAPAGPDGIRDYLHQWTGARVSLPAKAISPTR